MALSIRQMVPRIDLWCYCWFVHQTSAITSQSPQFGYAVNATKAETDTSFRSLSDGNTLQR